MNNMENMENLRVVFPFMTMSNKPQNENPKINIARNFRTLTIQTWRRFTVSRNDENSWNSSPSKPSGNFTHYQIWHFKKIYVPPTQCIYVLYGSDRKQSDYSLFQTFAVFRMLYAFFWVIPRRLNFICRRFGTHCLFHLHRQVGVKYD